ncbi:MAG: class I SAM-dependent methyltransferase [Planctomycetaceae bacterium]|nr:class I SAM-dependent methyltransferase [Planctomycetaceae bacterium]
MGLPKPNLRFLALEHKRKPFSGSVLTLGRQCVYATFDECCDIIRQEGITPEPLSASEELGTNIPHWKGTFRENYSSDVAFFKLLGIHDCPAMDYSDYEGAQFVFDLNDPLPDEFTERFDMILDAGTLEHVFDVRRALANVATMLKPGGRVIHVVPANNYSNHGFYQFSPTLFADFYRANRFEDLRLYVADEFQRRGEMVRVDLFSIDVTRQPQMMRSNSRRRMLVYCVATKTSDSTSHVVPTQSAYEQTYHDLGDSACTLDEYERIPTMWFNRLVWRLLPSPVYSAFRQLWIRFRTRFVDERAQYRPWGLRFTKRL